MNALFGDPRYVMEIDRETGGAVGEDRHLLGRDGVLTNNRQYVSAVAVLTGETLASVERRELFAELREATPGFTELPRAERADRYGAALEGRTFLPGFRHSLDVIEAISKTATPLPEHWFSGPRDSRWRWAELKDGGIRLNRIRGPRED